jgi:DNA-binding NarL/FixJ family response regulator
MLEERHPAVEAIEADSLAAAEAACANRDDIEVVVLDLNLPDAKGLLGLQTFIERFPYPRVAVLSGSVDPTFAAAAIACGAAAFVLKSADMGALKDTLSALLIGPRAAPLDQPVPAADQDSGQELLSRRNRLTTREVQVLELLLRGCTNQEIAETTGLTKGTVKNYISVLFSTFEVTSRSRLIALFV